MTQVALPHLIEYPTGQLAPYTAAWNLANHQLTASTFKLAYTFQITRAGTLRYFEFLTGVTSLVGTVRVSFQDIDSSGNPDGTQDQFRDVGSPAAGWVVPGGAMTSDGTNTGTKRTVAYGDWIAVVVEFSAYTSGTFRPQSVGWTRLNWGFMNLFSGASWAKVDSSHPGACALLYDDGTYEPLPFGSAPIIALSTKAFNVNTLVADEYALRFSLPFDCTVRGMWCGIQVLAGADFEVNIYSGTTKLVTLQVDGDYRHSNAGNTITTLQFASELALSRGTVYRLGVRPTTTTSVTLDRLGINSSGLLGACPGGAEFYESTRLDQGAWSDNQSARPWMGLLISKISDSVAPGTSAPMHRIFEGM